MTTVSSLIRLRHTTTHRIVAAVLFVLATLPFTAPFATVDLADLGNEAPLHGDLLSSAKTVKGTATLEEAVAPFQPPTMIAVLLADLSSAPPASQSVPQLVLRL
jgi:hypothetical protein